ncbi:MAG: hypothetical protein Edafosvirus4_52 [Edafosvirus sp.]|uniref:Uncharacterized protein n=1 Tax=Edafosvirus sp. TaxID=2487765 RepID=A0A3G4ZT55_9VIRU|nr:MAG: hypothetical protein Edafosvirus4_52 [Edafosvirus sp.]
MVFTKLIDKYNKYKVKNQLDLQKKVFKAIDDHNEKLVCQLIDKIDDVNFYDVNDQTVLRSLIKGQMGIAVKKCIKKGYHLNIQEYFKTMPNETEYINTKTDLMLAIHYNLDKSFCMLLDNNKRYNLNIRDSLGNNALMYSVIYSNYGIMNKLIDSDCKLNIKNNDGKTALMLQIIMDQGKQYQTIWKRMNASRSINDIATFHYENPDKIYIDHDIVIKKLISLCDLKIKDNIGRTALSYSLNKDDEKCFQILKLFLNPDHSQYYSDGFKKEIQNYLNHCSKKYTDLIIDQFLKVNDLSFLDEKIKEKELREYIYKNGVMDKIHHLYKINIQHIFADNKYGDGNVIDLIIGFIY